MTIKKSKSLSFIIAITMLASLILMPMTSFAKTISEKVDDAIDEIDDLENDMNDLEEEIDNNYGETVNAGDMDISDTLYTPTVNLYITDNDSTWETGDCIYTAANASTVQVGDTRVIPCSSFAGGINVATDNGDIGTSVYLATNLSITGTDTTWTLGEEVYDAAGATVAINDKRVTHATIGELAELSSFFTEISNKINDVQDELDDLKGYTIADDDLDDLENAVDDFVRSAEDVKDVIDDSYNTVLSDEFDDKETDFEDDIDDLDDDLTDVKNGVDTDNADVDDFVDDMNDLKDNVDTIRDTLPMTINTESEMQGDFDDLQDEVDDAEDLIDDLDGEEFSSTDQTTLNDAWDDFKNAVDDLLQDIEDAVDDGTDHDLNDDFDDEKEDFNNDLENVDDKFNNILAGEAGNALSRKVENAIDDIDDARDEIKTQKSAFIRSYNLDIETGDEDVGDGVTAVSLYSTNAAWTTNEYVYDNGTGTGVDVDNGDTRITHYSTTYKAETNVISGDSDEGVGILTETLFYKNGDVYYYCAAHPASNKVTTSCKRVSRETLMYDTELDDLFENIKDEMDNVDDALQDVQDEDLSEYEIGEIEDAYNSFQDKLDTFVSDIDDTTHSTLDDDFSDLSDDYDRDLDDLSSLLDDIKEGTSSSVSKVVTDFEDELNNIEDDIDDEKTEVTSTITDTNIMSGHFDDLDDLLDDVEAEIEDLAGYSFSDAEEGRINDVFDDIRNATDETVDRIEDYLANDNDLEDDFDDEKNDIEDDMDLLEADLVSILAGGSGATRAINDLIDDLKDSKNDIDDDVYSKVKGMSAGSISTRSDMNNYMDDVINDLGDAEDSLKDFDEIPTNLGVSRIKSAISGIEDKMDDAVNGVEDALTEDDDFLNDKFKNAQDDVDDAFSDVEDAAQYIYDLLPDSGGSGDDGSGDDGSGDDGSGDDGSGDDGSGDDGSGDDDGNGYPDVSFLDVPSTNVFNEYITALASLSIINGYYDGTFRPNNPVTRGEFLKIAAGAAEANVGNPSGSQRFVDVPSYHTFYSWVDYAATMGYISGYSDGTFRPDDYITRFEAVVILLRFMGTPVPTSSGASQYFIDVTSPAIAAYVDAAFENGLISGYPDNTFKPDNNISRGETSKIAVNGFS